MKFCFKPFALPILALSLAVVPARATVIPVTADATLSATSPNIPFGTTSTLRVDAILFDSKGNDATGHAPVLDITLVNQGPAGATGANGASGAPGQNGSNGSPGAPGANGGQVWSTNISFPTPSALQYSAPTGATAAVDGSASGYDASPLVVAIPVPAACTAGGFTAAVLTGENIDSTYTLSLMSTHSTASLLSCSISNLIASNEGNLSSGTTCPATGTVALAAGTPLYIRFQVSGTPLPPQLHLSTSFVCQ